MTTAIGLAIDEAVQNGRPQAVLLDKHLVDTVVESVAHKIYDNFSPGARPDLTEKKEKAVKTICQQVFNVDRFRRIVRARLTTSTPSWAPSRRGSWQRGAPRTSGAVHQGAGHRRGRRPALAGSRT